MNVWRFISRIKYGAVAVILITAFVLQGCSSHKEKIVHDSEQRRIVVNSDEGGQQTPPPVHPENPELYEAFEDAFDARLVIINTYTMRIGYTDAENFILTRMRYVQKAKKLRELMRNALDATYKKAVAIYPGFTVLHIENITYPTWQYLAAALYFETDENALLYDLLSLKISVTESGGIKTVTVTAVPKDIRRFAAEKAGEQETANDAANTYLSVRYTFAYLSAMFDDEGNSFFPDSEETSPSPTPAPEPEYYDFGEEYMKGLCYPLDNMPAFRDSWGQGRSSNTRRHAGTDIASREGYNVYSVSSGTVVYKGTDKIPGNYLIILDDEGYEYHYYHLVELPPECNIGDRVQAGDIIAHVGNTGNSDSDHLHVSIIGKDGVFINPYKLLKTLEERKRGA